MRISGSYQKSAKYGDKLEIAQYLTGGAKQATNSDIFSVVVIKVECFFLISFCYYKTLRSNAVLSKEALITSIMYVFEADQDAAESARVLFVFYDCYSA